MKYCLDTNFFIECWHRHYWPDVFQSLWEGLDEMIVNGEIISPREVHGELEKKDGDLLFQWVKARPAMFVPLDEEIQKTVTALIRQFPNLLKQTKHSEKNHGDPFVVAVASVKGATVVTDEIPGSQRKPKMPDLCNWLGVPHINTKQFILLHAKRKGWKF